MDFSREDYERMQDLLNQYEALKEKLFDRAAQVLRLKFQLEGEKWPQWSDVHKVEPSSDGKIYITLVSPAHCSCCSDDYDTYNFPYSWLFDSDLETKIKQQIEEKKIAAEAEARKKAEAAKVEQERRERAQYESLKKKFES